MGFAVTEMAFSPPLSTPITYDHWMEITQSLGECVESRQIQWLCSLVSVQGDRSLCVYQVPYTDAVREAYREAGMPFQQAWQADLWVDYDPASLPQGDTLIMVDVIMRFQLRRQRMSLTSNGQRTVSMKCRLNILFLPWRLMEPILFVYFQPLLRRMFDRFTGSFACPSGKCGKRR